LRPLWIRDGRSIASCTETAVEFVGGVSLT